MRKEAYEVVEQVLRHGAARLALSDQLPRKLVCASDLPAYARNQHPE